MLDTGLADRLRRKGVEVVEVAGWPTRSAGSYSPRGSVNHHTAGSRIGAVPSLATCIYGRSDLPGPLCNVLQSREPNGRDKAYVIAAGRANHAGKGSWRGLSGNGAVGGLEVEHVGTGPVAIVRLDVSARIQAALLEAPGSSRSASLCCQHFEWTPRKIDFNSLAPWTPDIFRQQVAYWIGRDAGSEIEVEDDDPMVIIRNKTTKHALTAWAGKLSPLTGEGNATSAEEAGIPVWWVDQTQWDRILRVYGPPVN